MTFPSELQFDDKSKFVQALLACSSMSTRQSRDLVIGDLNASIRNAINRMENNQQDVHSLVVTCLSFAGGVDQLLDRLVAQEGDTIHWQQLAHVRYEICARASESRPTQAMLDEVKPLLRVPLPSELVSKCFGQSCTAPRLPSDPEPADAYEAFLWLFDFGALNALGFLERLAAQPEMAAKAQALRQCAQALAGKLQLTAEFTTQQAENIALANEPVFLLIQVLPTNPQAESFTVQAWGWREADDCQRLDTPDQPCRFSAIEKISRKLVRDVEELFQTTDIVVELIAPRAVFCEDLSTWRIDVGEMESAGTLWLQHRLALRWIDRFRDRRKHPRWRAKWDAVRDAKTRAKKIALDWLACADECTAMDLIDNLAEAHCGAFLAFGFVPIKQPNPEDLLFASLNAGTPVALWFRQLHAGEQFTLPDIQTLLGQALPADLPQKLRELRHQHRKDSNHPAHRLMLLFDDYYRVPPTLVTQAPARPAELLTAFLN